MAVVEARDLRRVYKTHTGTIRRRVKEIEAVRGVSFQIEKGELFGLLGPNGAGKTTTIKMLITLLIPTAGSASVLGHDVVKEPREVRKRIGYVFGGERGVYERLSGYDNLRYFAELYGVPPKTQKKRIEELLELVGLKGREHERTEGYSRGMKQRLHVARGLLHDPEVVFLDEPTIGLDPVGARELRATIGTLTQAGKTILLTTHYMFEADALCDRIAVISQGEIVAEGTPEQLKSRVASGAVTEVEVYGIPDETVERLRTLEGVMSVWVEERDQAQVLSVQTRADVQLTAAILGHLNGSNVGRVSHREPTLEDAYVALVKDESRTLRLLGIGWQFHFKMIMRSAFDGVGQVIYPLFFATVAFFVFRAGDSPRTLLYASLGSAVMGMWSATSTTAGSAMQRERWQGTLEALVATPTNFALILLPVTIAMATIGIYSLVATLLWGRLLFGIHLTFVHPVMFVLSIPATVLTFGALGFLFAVCFVRFRAAWALGNMFEYPVWLICGFLVPLTFFPYWVRPISWILAPTWGMNAIRESSLGGSPLPDLLMCFALGTAYIALGFLVMDRLLRAARERAALSLT